jgi:cytochrome P450
MVKHKDAWSPFSTGPFGCIGKNLALMEIRLLTTELLLRYDVRLAEGEDGSKLLKGTRDHFTLGLGDLMVLWEERKN